MERGAMQGSGYAPKTFAQRMIVGADDQARTFNLVFLLLQVKTSGRKAQRKEK